MVRDVATTEIFPDAEYHAWLERQLSAEFLALYYPSSTAGVTTATAGVVLVSATSLMLELRVNGVLTSVTLARSDENTVGDLVDRIGVAAPGWVVGFSSGPQHRVQWSDYTALPWRDVALRPTLRQMVDHARPSDLALTRQGAVDALGDEDNYARLRWFLLADALVASLRGIEGRAGGDAGYTSRTKGNSSWSRGDGGLSARISAAEHQAGFGIYQAAI